MLMPLTPVRQLSILPQGVAQDIRRTCVSSASRLPRTRLAEHTWFDVDGRMDSSAHSAPEHPRGCTRRATFSNAVPAGVRRRLSRARSCLARTFRGRSGLGRPTSWPRIRQESAHSHSSDHVGSAITAQRGIFCIDCAGACSTKTARVCQG